MPPLVSILVPAYNAEEWLGETLRSALVQTWEPKEIIVVDDGSTDKTLDLARSFECKGVQVVAQRNQGAAAARNKAFSLSRGQYIQWLDADDILAGDKITSQMKLLERATKYTLLSCAWGQFIYRHNQARFIPSPLWADLSPVDWLIRKMGQNLYMPTTAWLVSRELSEKAGPWDPRMHIDDDGEYFCRVLLQTDEVLFAPKARMYYRDSGSGSLSSIGRSTQKLEAQFRSLQLHVKYLLQLENSPRTRATCVAFLQTWLVYFHPERPDIVAECRRMAHDLGGKLNEPSLSWKYAWIASLFGWKMAKRAWLFSPQVRRAFAKHWDKALFRVENASAPQSLLRPAD